MWNPSQIKALTSIADWQKEFMANPQLILINTRVDAEAVRIRFFPLGKKTIPLGDVVRWEARTYRPIREYGGWGIRYTLGRGWAYNVRGKQGVQLELANGQRILIGSQRAEELAAAIAEAKRSAGKGI